MKRSPSPTHAFHAHAHSSAQNEHLSKRVKTGDNTAQVSPTTSKANSNPSSPIHALTDSQQKHNEQKSPQRSATNARGIRSPSPRRSSSPTKQKAQVQVDVEMSPRSPSTKNEQQRTQHHDHDTHHHAVPPIETAASSAHASGRNQSDMSSNTATWDPSIQHRAQDTSTPLTHTQNNSTQNSNTSSPNIKSDQPKSQLEKEQLKWCNNVLRHMKRNINGKPFLSPVDPIAMNIPTYSQIIKTPMDISTIDRKLSTQQYPRAQAFIDDFHLMINNSSTFNPPEHSVHKQGKILQEWFHKQVEKSFPHETKVKPTTPKSASYASEVLDSGFRPKRETHPPSKEVMTFTKDAAVKNKHNISYREQMRFATSVWKNLMKPKNIQTTQFFKDPVDPVALQIPTYFDVVKHPMDMTTIKRKLDSNTYDGIEDFEADINQMLDNCFLFNHEGDAVYSAGVHFKSLFDYQMSQKPQFTDEMLEIEDPEIAKAAAEERDIITEMRVIEEQMEAYKTKLSALQEKLSKVQRKKQSLLAARVRTPHKANKTPKAAPTTKTPRPRTTTARQSKAKPLNHAQKQQLSEAVGMLSPGKLVQVVDIIKANQPGLLGNQDEVELDIDKINDETLRKLYTFAVGKHAHKKKLGAERQNRISELEASLVELNGGKKKTKTKGSLSSASGSSDDEDSGSGSDSN